MYRVEFCKVVMVRHIHPSSFAPNTTGHQEILPPKGLQLMKAAYIIVNVNMAKTVSSTGHLSTRHHLRQDQSTIIFFVIISDVHRSSSSTSMHIVSLVITVLMEELSSSSNESTLFIKNIRALVPCLLTTFLFLIPPPISKWSSSGSNCCALLPS